MRSAITRAWAGVLPAKSKAVNRDGAPLVMRRPEVHGTDRSGWDESAAITEGYEGNVWVHTGVTLKARAASQVPLVVQTRNRDGSWEAAGNGGGELGRLIEEPSPDHDTSSLLFRALAMQDVTGNFLAKIQRRGDSDRGPILALWPLISGYKPIRGDGTGYATAYENTSVTGVDRKLPAENVVHWMYPNLRDHAWGLSPLKAAREAIVADNEANIWNRMSMQNRAALDLLLTSSFGTADKDKFKWLRQLISTELQGSNNAHKVAVLPGDFKVHEMDRSPVEMDFLATQKFTIQKLAAALGLLPALLSPEAATYSNLQGAIQYLWDTTITGWLRDFCAVLRRRVVPAFGDPKNMRIVADLGAVSALKEAMLQRVETMERLTRIGTPYDEAKELLELDLVDQPGGDVPHGLSLAARIAESRAGAVPVTGGTAGMGGAVARSRKAVPGPSRSKDAARREIEPLWALAQRIGGRVGAEFRRLVAQLEAARRGDLEALVAALATGDDAALPIAAGLPQLHAGIVDAFGQPVGAGAAEGAAAGREALSKLAGRELSEGTGLVLRRAEEAVATAAEFIRQSSERALIEMVKLLRTLGLADEELAKLAPLLPSIAATNAPQAGAIGKMTRDLLQGGMGLDAVIPKLRRALDKAIATRSAGIGSDLGTRSVFGGYRWAGEDAVTSGELQLLIRMWVDSDDPDVCPECISLDEQQARNAEPYVSPLSGRTYHGPPDPHPDTCRCGELFTEAYA